MNIEKILINGHYVWVDNDADVKEGGTFLTKENEIHKNYGYNYGDRVIVAASAELNLEGIPTYPELLAEQEANKEDWDFESPYGNGYEDFKNGIIKGYEIAEKELQKQLITEIMNEDAKDGLYDEYEQISQDNPVTRGSTALVKKSQTEEQQRPTWDDVRKAIKITSATILNHLQSKTDLLHIEEIIEQLKQGKK